MRLLFAAAWFTASVASAGAPAGKPAGKDPKASAKDLVSSGNEFYAKKEYRAALALFERAFDVYPSPMIYYNIARAHHELGNLLRAATYYEKFLAESGVEPRSKRRELAVVGLGEIEQGTGKISIRGAPDEAELRIDGAIIERAEAIRVLPGEHEITARLANHVPFRQSANVEAGAVVTVELALIREVEEAPPQVQLVPAVEPIESESVAEKWWFWTLLAAGVAVAAGVTVAATVGKSAFARDGELDTSSTRDWESF